MLGRSQYLNWQEINANGKMSVLCTSKHGPGILLRDDDNDVDIHCVHSPSRLFKNSGSALLQHKGQFFNTACYCKIYSIFYYVCIHFNAKQHHNGICGLIMTG